MSDMEEKLKKYCTVISGYAFKSKNLSEGTDIPVIKIGNISNGKNIIIDDATQYVNKKFFCIDEKYHIKYGDILISLTGSHINQPNSMAGRCCRNVSNTVYLLNQRAEKIIPKKTVNKNFLYYVFCLKSIQYAIANRAYGGSNQVNVSHKDVMSIKFRIPDITVQKKIADTLSTYDNLIKNNNKRIKLLEQMAENLYKEWFVRFRFPGYKDVEFENEIPKNWLKDKIRTYYETTSGGTPKRSNSDYFESGNIPWLKTGELNDCIILYADEHITELGLKKSSAKWLPKNSIAMAMYAGNNVGKLGYLDIEMTCSQACCILYDKRKFSSKHYLFHYLLSIREYLQNISFGAAQQNISQDLINKVNIIMPSDEVVRLFEEKINDIYNETKILLKQNKVLIKQRDLLLPRLMSGKLEV